MASISTSGGLTSGGKNPSGKIQKLRADMLFLVMATAELRLLVLTESEMYSIVQKEVSAGRVPKEITLLLAELPAEIAERLKAAREISSKEVRPAKTQL